MVAAAEDWGDLGEGDLEAWEDAAHYDDPEGADDEVWAIHQTRAVEPAEKRPLDKAHEESVKKLRSSAGKAP